MLKKLLFFCLVLPAVLALFLASPASAKPRPLPEIMGMFTTFNQLEEHFRQADWDGAMNTVQKVEADYLKLVKEMKGTVDAKLIQKFSFLITSFKKKLAQKDAEAVEKPYANLQSMFLDIMDYYDYPSPPVLIVMAEFVEEAKESLARGDIDDAGEEMEEIADFRDRALKAMADKGIASQKADDFFEMVEQSEELVKSKNKATFQKNLDTMTAFLAPFASTGD